jgi:hypothetical protein
LQRVDDEFQFERYDEVARMRVEVEKVSSVLNACSNGTTVVLDIDRIDRNFEQKIEALCDDAKADIAVQQPPDELGKGESGKSRLEKAHGALTALKKFSAQARPRLADLSESVIKATEADLTDMWQGDFSAKGSRYATDNSLCAKVLAWRFQQCEDLEVGDRFKIQAKSALRYKFFGVSYISCLVSHTPMLRIKGI